MPARRHKRIAVELDRSETAYESVTMSGYKCLLGVVSGPGHMLTALGALGALGVACLPALPASPLASGHLLTSLAPMPSPAPAISCRCATESAITTTTTPVDTLDVDHVACHALVLTADV